MNVIPLSECLFVLSYGKAKQTVRCAAESMYTGGYFRSNYRYAMSIVPDRKQVMILSAKLGFIPLDLVIDPYDVVMGSKKAVSIEFLKAQALSLGLLKRPCLALCLGPYIKALREVFPTVIDPFVGFSMFTLSGHLKANAGVLLGGKNYEAVPGGFIRRTGLGDVSRMGAQDGAANAPRVPEDRPT